MKLLKLSVLLHASLILAGCSASSSPSAADKPETLPPPPPPQPEAVSVADAEKTSEAEPAVFSLDVRKAPAQTDAAPAATAPAEQSPQKDVPAGTEKAAETVQFRCAYWSRPEEAPELYLISDGEFRRCEIFELAFPRVYNVPAEEKITFYVRTDEGAFAPFLSADRADMTNCAAILLPNFGNPEYGHERRIQLFNFDENAMPFGTLVIYNWFPETISGEVHFRKDARNAASTQIFTLHSGEFCTTLPIADVKRMCNIELKSDDGEGGWTSIFSSSLPVFGGSRTYIYMIPKNDGGQNKLDFRIFTIRQEKK